MEVRELLGRFSHPKFGIKRMTMYGVPVSEWVSDLSFLDWCRMQGERSGFWAMEDVFDWALWNVNRAKQIKFGIMKKIAEFDSLEICERWEDVIL